MEVKNDRCRLKSVNLKMFLGKRTKYQYFNEFTSIAFDFQYDASYIIIIRNET